MDVDAALVGVVGVAPHDRVVANDAAGRMVEGSQDGVAGVVAHIQVRAEAFDFIGPDNSGIDALNLVDLRPPAHGAHRAVGVGQRQMPTLAEHDVEIKLD